MNILTIDKQALRNVAKNATHGGWIFCRSGYNSIVQAPAVLQRGGNARVVVCKLLRSEWRGELKTAQDAVFIAAFNPNVALALLDELQIKTETIAHLDRELSQRNFELEAAEKRIAELSEAASVNSQWKPDVCPLTRRQFFMWIDHPQLGHVPTYGGPFDSYTIPTQDADGEFSCEHFDHDRGAWVCAENPGLHLVDDDELCRVYELEQRIVELESEIEN